MECHWSKQIWFAYSLGVVFNSHDSRYVHFHKWFEKNIIDVDENIIVHILALCYEIYGVLEIRNVLRGLMLTWLPLFKRHKDLL